MDCRWDGPPFHWDDCRRFLLRCELDAAFFHLYLLRTRRVIDVRRVAPTDAPVTKRLNNWLSFSSDFPHTTRRCHIHHGHISERPPKGQ